MYRQHHVSSWPTLPTWTHVLRDNVIPALQTLAEKAAWKLAKEHGIDLVTINPVFVVGPVISKRTDATTVTMLIVCSCALFTLHLSTLEQELNTYSYTGSAFVQHLQHGNVKGSSDEVCN